MENNKLTTRELVELSLFSALIHLAFRFFRILLVLNLFILEML